MEIEVKVEECYKYHDSENIAINENAEKLAERIKSEIGYRKLFCNCEDRDCVISIKADRIQTKEYKIISGCEHFREQLVKTLIRIPENEIGL